MEREITKPCLEYIVKALNCEFGKNFKIKKVKDKFIIVDEKNLENYIKSLHLEIKNGNELKIFIKNVEEENILTKLQNTLQKYAPKIIEKGLEITFSDDKVCSITGILADVFCKFIKINFGN